MKYIKNISEHFPGSGVPDEYQRRTGDMSGDYKHMHVLSNEPKSETKNVSHLNFLNNFIDNLTEIKARVDETGIMNREDQNWIEELYSLHKNSIKD